MLTNNAFTYDQVGNRLSKQQNSSQSNALVAGTFNNLNQLTALTGGSGKLQVNGTINKTSKVTEVSGTNSYPATALWGTNFSASIPVALGTNTFSVVAQDANTNLVTNTYQIGVTALEGSRSFSYDANGNCLSDGQRSYTWDAANRLATITVGTNTYSFGYDFAGRRISEKLNGTLIKQTLWDTAGNAPTPLEERNAANAVAKRFFAQGEQQNGTNYYYLRDHLGSVREMVTGSGQIVSEATYDPYGVATVTGTVIPTFQYAGYYTHQGSGLNLTWYRSYDPVIGRWQSRDPLKDAERVQGINLYEYVANNPINLIDGFGLQVDGGVNLTTEERILLYGDGKNLCKEQCDGKKILDGANQAYFDVIKTSIGFFKGASTAEDVYDNIIKKICSMLKNQAQINLEDKCKKKCDK
jgi:RHS repeat-associated protein